MAQGPCLNPDCKSHGQPHPNCKCYGGRTNSADGNEMAEGGKVYKGCECCKKQKLADTLMTKGGDVSTTSVESSSPEHKKQGYSFTHTKHADNDLDITAHHNGKKVGAYKFFTHSQTGTPHVQEAETFVEHQRKGLATEAYKQAQNHYGKKLEPKPDQQSPNAKAMWANKKFAAGGSVKKSQGPLGIDLNKFKHIHSDDKATTLKHKDGHELRIAHNAVGPKIAAALKALSPMASEHATANQAQESQDQSQYGKVIQKASGGTVKSGSPTMDYCEGGQAPQSPRYAHGGIHQSNKGFSNDTADMPRQLADDSYAKGGQMPYSLNDNNDDMYAEGGDVIDTISKAADAALDWLGGDARATTKAVEADRAAKSSYGGVGGSASFVPPTRRDPGTSQSSSSSGYASGGTVQSGSRDMNLADGSQYPIMEGKTQARRKMYADESTPVSQDDNAPQEPIADSQNLSPDQLQRAHEALGKISKLKEHLQSVVHGAGQAWAGAMGPAVGPDGKTMPSNAQNAVAAENNPDQAQPDVSQDPNTPVSGSQMMSKGAPSDINQPTEMPADQPSPQPDSSQPAALTQQAAPTPVQPTVQQQAEQALQRTQQDPKTPPDVRAAPPAKQVQYDQNRQQTLQDMTKDSVDWQQAIANSQITPKTYSDLFHYNDGNVKPGNERSTLSKIGMLFASLVGGAGAGLSHQPNAMLGMMDNVIKNDLDAQTKSKQNAYNYYNLAVQHEMNKAQEGQLNIDTKQKAYNLSLMHMRNSAFADLVKKGNAIQDPKQKQAYMEGLAMMGKEIEGANYDLAGQFAIAQARQKMILGDMNQAGPGQPQGNIDPAREVKRRELTGVMSPADAAAAREEIKMVQNHNQVNQNSLDSFDKVAQMTKLSSRRKNPIQSASRIDAEWDPMIDKLTKDTSGRVTPISTSLVSGVKPLPWDDDETIRMKRDKFNRLIHSGYATPTLDGNNISIEKGMPGPIEQGQQPQIKEYNGKRYRRGPNGESIEVK